MTFQEKIQKHNIDLTTFILLSIGTSLAWGVSSATFAMIFTPENSVLQLFIFSIATLVNVWLSYKNPQWYAYKTQSKEEKQNRLEVLEKEFTQQNESLDLLYQWIQMRKINVEEFSYLLSKRGK